jgi:tRNA modification GTPase
MQGSKLKDYRLSDTIAAIATFPAKSALGVIKLSGKKALGIVHEIFRPAKKKNIKKVKTYTLHYGWITEKAKTANLKPQTATLIDEVLVSIMKAPSSYTREDVVEISCHGGIIVLNKILEIILKKGARLALPGEFTYRALINGRIDLLQAESVLGIVEARTEEGLNLASSQLLGEASLKIKALKKEVGDFFIETESLINFPEDEVKNSPQAIRDRINILERKISGVLEGGQEANIIKEGLKCVICGKTNVGKSTLFNRLLKEERVIVSKLPGTTRDIVEETINIRGIPLRLYDTAGILEPKDLIARKAMQKAEETFDKADLVILLLDGSRPLNKDDSFLIEKAKDKNKIIVINKIDLPIRLNIKDIPGAPLEVVRMSALKNIGLNELEKAVYKFVYHRGVLDRENIIFLSRYQHEILKKVNENIRQAKAFLKEGRSIDFINLALKECLDNLGKLSGEVLSEEILESIFSRFCIGK